MDKVTLEGVSRIVVGYLIAVAAGLGVYHITHSVVATAMVAALASRITHVVGL